MKRLLVLLLIVGFAQEAASRSCHSKTFPDAITESDMIIIGFIHSAKAMGDNLRYEIEVVEALKGTSDNPIYLDVAIESQEGMSCSPKLWIGRKNALSLVAEGDTYRVTSNYSSTMGDKPFSDYIELIERALDQDDPQ